MNAETTKKEYQLDPDALKKYSICVECKLFDSNGSKCRACGCDVRPNLENSHFLCPMRKW